MVAVGLTSSLLKVGRNQVPDTDNILNDFTQKRHWEVSGPNSRSHSMSRCCPASVLSAIQSLHNDLRHWKRVPIAKHDWETILGTSFNQPQVESGVLDQRFSVPIPSKFNVGVTKYIWSPKKRNKWHWGTNNTQTLPQNSGITANFSTVFA